MRSLGALTSWGSRSSPAVPDALAASSPLARGLRLLFVPNRDEAPGAATAAGFVGRNLAEGMRGASTAAASLAFSRQTSGVMLSTPPRVERGIHGPFWQFYQGGTSVQQAMDVERGAPWGWDPSATGGYQAITMFAVVRLRMSSAGVGHCIMEIRQSSTCLAALYHNSGNFQLNIATGTLRTVATSETSFVNDLAVFIGTSRSATDHEITVRNLRSGAIVHATSVLNSGATGSTPTALTLGGVRSTAAVFGLGNHASEVYALGLYDRGMARAEMVDLARNPFALWRPSVQRRAVVSSGVVTGDLAVTEDADTLAATGQVPFIGTLSVTEDADTLAATGSVQLVGELAVTEDADALVSSGLSGDGVVAALGELVLLEDDDTLAATGSVRLVGDLAVTEDADTLAAVGVSGTNGPFLRRRTLIFT
jgi:hypothetical protein